MVDIWRDVKHSVQALVKNPGFTLTAVAALALGIGANAAIFTVVNAVLLKPLTYPDADRIVQFQHHAQNGSGEMLSATLASIPAFRVYQHQTNVFQDVAAFDFTTPGFNLTGDRPEQLTGIHVSEAYFRLFGAPVILGRTFTPQEDAPHGGKNVVISYGLWQRRFGGDAAIAGKSLLLGNEPYTILGVIGKEFQSDPQADIWLPFQFEMGSNNMNQFFQAAARLRPGVTVAEANAQMKLATAEYYREHPTSDPRDQSLYMVAPLRDSIVADARRSLLVMLGAVSLVLLIACANVASLLLVRATGRKRELAIRTALGASRGRIAWQLLTESLLLSVLGGVVGLGVGFAGVRALLAVSPAGLPRIGENGSSIVMDWRVIAFTLGVSIFTGLLFGLFPAFAASRSDLNASLNEGSNRAGSGFRQSRSRSLLVISEISLALVLLISATLLIRSFIALHQVGPGFEVQNVLTAEMSMTGERLHTSAGIAQLSREGRTRLNALPGVEVSASTVWLPDQVNDALGFQIVGRPADRAQFGSRWMSFSPGYLNVFRIPVLRGRDFNENDDAAHPLVALINQALANECWPGENPVGQQVIIGKGMSPETDEPARTIVGIVGDTRNNGLSHPPDPMMMVPTAQVVNAYAAAYSDTSALIWVVRTRSDPHAFIPAVADQLRLASGGFPVAHVRTMEEVMGHSVARENFNMLVLTIFGGLALTLAAIGIYGLMAYSVEQRTREMGIRMALGADRAAIRTLVIRNGVRLASAGVLLGIVASFGLTRLLGSFLFGVKAWDPTAFITAPVILSVVVVLAVWVPAARAARVDPIDALRTE